ncbi:protein kinase domain-containing protein [Streptomyces sp. NPDC001118]
MLLDRSCRVVLTDFGIATMDDPGDGSATRLTRSGELVGSLDYLAPEHAQDAEPGPPADVWALGATLYAAVEGASPFRRTSTYSTLTAIVAEPLPEPRRAGPLTPVLRRLMDKRPDARPDAEEAREALREVAQPKLPDTPTTTLRPTPPPPPEPTHRSTSPAPPGSGPGSAARRPRRRDQGRWSAMRRLCRRAPAVRRRLTTLLSRPVQMVPGSRQVRVIPALRPVGRRGRRRLTRRVPLRGPVGRWGRCPPTRRAPPRTPVRPPVRSPHSRPAPHGTDPRIRARRPHRADPRIRVRCAHRAHEYGLRFASPEGAGSACRRCRRRRARSCRSHGGPGA